ncbi:AAA domain (dynein-related subfamily) [Aquiflexum balticum DSM 16537]|uniref:AAA domain (Dynein-related subfamily) n=1 Tax=Aquiflexum balticum DSM 16537 TaxID=758820 RepID=A0A1W2H7F9_9BACT|nr:AAA family ATPase [Aquiflexum balticum]SMD44857.1 AAA domain (dynein-related subfamily) [Aquiflexum balticum DSM 16537]
MKNSAHFLHLFEEYKNSDLYEEREGQKAIIPIFRQILAEALTIEPFTNQVLTDLIQIFKYNCTDDTFDKKLKALVLDEAKRKSIWDAAMEHYVPGFTNAGKTGIVGLKDEDLQTVKEFLVKAFKVTTVQEAKQLVREYENKKVPKVKRGVYSPWLFYINPTLFPIFNNSYKNFINWYDIPNEYQQVIDPLHELKSLVNEEDFSHIDQVAHIFTKEGRLFMAKTLELDGQSIYKISHGALIFNTDFDNAAIIDIVDQNNLITLNRYTKRGQGEKFVTELKEGDYVYLCYGGDKIKWIGQVTSGIEDFSPDIASLFGPEKEDWIYREVKPIYFPKDEALSGLKDQRSMIMPSGNSTFWKIKPSELESINKLLFLPYFNLKVIDNDPNEEFEDQVEDETEAMEAKSNNPLNLILYGPPGTGKTYRTIDISLEIIDDEVPEKRSEAKQRFASLQLQRRVFFNTFHQNMAYEDFIEGIKPVQAEDEDSPFLKYEIQDGLFMQACIEATYNYHVKNNKSDQLVEQILDFNGLYDLLFEEVSKGAVKEIKTVSNNDLEINITSQGNFVLVHKGRERAYTVSKDRLSKIYDVYPNPSTMTNIHENIRDIIGRSNSTAYWAVLNKIASYRVTNKKPHSLAIAKELSYEDKKKVIQSIWSKRSVQVVSNDKSDPFVFIIDEINRGNVSQIFGELITLIEPDKRMGKDEVLYVDLPYSKNAFAVPPNLYIIGTMNTADRSVEALDTALRRRFSFKAMSPLPEELKPTTDGIDLPKMLSRLNERLTVLKDNDHTIGHAWFWNVTEIEGLRAVYANKILPLLQEFFYNDYEKLGLVLGDAFFEGNTQVNSNIFAKFSAGNDLGSQYEQVWQYRLKDSSKLTKDDFQSIYS